MTATTRSTLRARAMRAGGVIADDAPLSTLLAPHTVADADAALALIQSRRESAEAAAASHATTRDDALLAGTETAHDAEAQRLADDARRLTVAAERITTRRADLITTERLTEARERVRVGQEAAQRADDLTLKYAGLARQIAATLAELSALFADVEAGRRAAHEHDLDTEGLILPHESRSRSGEFKTVEVEVVSHGPRVTDAEGRNLSKGPQESAARFTRRESRLVRAQVTAPDLTAARIVLPDPDGGAAIVEQGRDRR